MNDEDENKIFNKIIFFLIGVVLFIFISIALMIPVANVFIAYAIFGGD